MIFWLGEKLRHWAQERVKDADAIRRVREFHARGGIDNAFGMLVTNRGTPIICGHGGSDWLCAACAREFTSRKGVRHATQAEQDEAWSGGTTTRSDTSARCAGS